MPDLVEMTRSGSCIMKSTREARVFSAIDQHGRASRNAIDFFLAARIHEFLFEIVRFVASDFAYVWDKGDQKAGAVRLLKTPNCCRRHKRDLLIKRLFH